MTFTDAETAYLAIQRLGRLAAVHPDGSQQVKPVGFRHNPGLGTIDVTGFNKAGLHGVTHFLATRTAPVGVTVNALAPALIADTALLPGDPQELRQQVPVGRLGRPDEVADLALAIVRTPTSPTKSSHSTAASTQGRPGAGPAQKILLSADPSSRGAG